MPLSLDAILVPQGSEFAAVKRGLPPHLRERIQAIPVGPDPLHRFLQEWHPPKQDKMVSCCTPARILMMGLCGALTPNHGVGDMVLYDTCSDGTTPDSGSCLACDPSLSQAILKKLQSQKNLPTIAQVQALSTAQVICRAQDKLKLASQFPASVVDMEGWVALQDLRKRGMAVAMLRVVSDDCQHDLPDLATAFSAEGHLLPLPLALGMIRQPLGALRLIRGSLRGLKVLEQLAATLTH
jgi:Phosphorylase superfamily